MLGNLSVNLLLHHAVGSDAAQHENDNHDYNNNNYRRAAFLLFAVTFLLVTVVFLPGFNTSLDVEVESHGENLVLVILEPAEDTMEAHLVSLALETSLVGLVHLALTRQLNLLALTSLDLQVLDAGEEEASAPIAVHGYLSDAVAGVDLYAVALTGLAADDTRGFALTSPDLYAGELRGLTIGDRAHLDFVDGGLKHLVVGVRAAEVTIGLGCKFGFNCLSSHYCCESSEFEQHFINLL